MNETNIRMIALDLDETTLATSTTLAERNRSALERAAERGIEIVIASGRSFVSMSGVVPLFPWSRYAICNNGATVNRLPSGEVLTERFVKPETVQQVLQLTKGRNITFEVYLNGQAYAQRDYIAAPERFMADEMTVDYVRRTRKPVENILDFLHENMDRLQSLVVVYGSRQEKAELAPVLQQLPDAYVTSAAPRMTEIGSPDCGKHKGLIYLAEQLGIDRREIIAFGNADNDADMLSWAGIGVAVANASETCRDCADLITADYRECGVAQTLEQLLGL